MSNIGGILMNLLFVRALGIFMPFGMVGYFYAIWDVVWGIWGKIVFNY